MASVEYLYQLFSILKAQLENTRHHYRMGLLKYNFPAISYGDVLAHVQGIRTHPALSKYENDHAQKIQSDMTRDRFNTFLGHMSVHRIALSPELLLNFEQYCIQYGLV